MKGYCTEVKQFSDACQDNKNPSTPQIMSTEAIAFIREMVNDELDELEEATNTHEQADALVDAIYYICDTAVRHGLNLDPLFSIVHRANMQKVVDGHVIRREDGKIMKPDCWQDPEPFLSEEMKKQAEGGSWNS
jgi:predicted HAD superfamily Cof-like phosphohydrolase